MRFLNIHSSLAILKWRNTSLYSTTGFVLAGLTMLIYSGPIGWAGGKGHGKLCLGYHTVSNML